MTRPLLPKVLLVLALWGVVLAPTAADAWCVGGAPPARDADGDGLNDIQEVFFALDPNDPDTDGDGTLDGDEDTDADGIKNHDEPHMFSLEIFNDPFSKHRVGLVLEGTNFFVPEERRRRAKVLFAESGRSRRVSLDGRRNLRTRIFLRLSQRRASKFLGAALDSNVQIGTDRGLTNVLHPVPMGCVPGPPHLMGAAIVDIASPILAEPLSYIVVGGCNLTDIERRRELSTTVRLADRDIEIRGRYGSSGLWPTRIMVPLESRANDSAVLPAWEPIEAGDTVSILTRSGESNAVLVEPPIAQLRIPPSNVAEDHDRDRLTSLEELTLGTDPLLADTDHDGIVDGREIGRTDPLDPDTDGDGILDGDE